MCRGLLHRYTVMLDIQIQDGGGGGSCARVVDDSLLTSANISPPLLPQKVKVFRQYMTDDGTATGTSDMDVNGSVTPVEYWIPSGNDADRYIATISFLLAKSGAALNEFGGSTALTNGCDLEYQRTGGETITIHGALKSNFDIVRLCMGVPAFGTGNAAFKVNNAIATDEAFIPVFDFTRILPPYGLKLDMGSTQKLIMRINDNLTAGAYLDNFDVIAYGFDRMP